MMNAHPILKDIVLVGAGHAHIGVLRMFGMKPIRGVRLTLITRQVDTPYSGMLPGMIAGHYSFDEAHIDVGPLCRFAGARLYHSAAVGLNLAGKSVLCDNRPPVPYDLVSINIGSTPGTRNTPGAPENTIPVKPIDGFLARFEAARARILTKGAKARIGVTGAGAGGTELALSLEWRLRRDAAASGFDPEGLQFAILTQDKEILASFPAAVRRRFMRETQRRGVEIIAGHRVARVDGGMVRLEGAAEQVFSEIFWTTEAAPAPWLAETGLGLNEQGFIAVSPTLQSVSNANVFAAGDIASIAGQNLPKSGVYAVRQGPALAENLRRAVTGKPLKPYRPQRDTLYLISTGERYAIGTRNGLSFEGEWVWRLKDWIDRRFMAQFNALPEMNAKAAAFTSPIAGIKDISGIDMRCGGCGAKVGATVLARALNAIEPAPRGDVVIGLDAPDDAAVVDNGGPRLSAHTVDYFRAPIDDPYIFGKIAANHALGDIYAMGAEPQTALAIATVPFGIEAKVEADLGGMMAGANEILREADCALVGGHTSEGAELSLGFAITGLVERALILRKGGLRPGDALILTKSIGTGTLLAADMRGKAKGRWVSAALTHMTRSNRAAARILRAHGVHAMTDVTGFGLLGHLVEMVRASGVEVTLALSRLPLLAGARETIAMEMFSSLQPQNLRLYRAIRNLEDAAQDPLYPMLFDPQTAGGLLASVPAEAAGACIKSLHESGYDGASVIGLVYPRSDAIEPVTIVRGEWEIPNPQMRHGALSEQLQGPGN